MKHKNKDKNNKINFIIDAFLFLSLTFTAGIGFLLKYAESIIKKMALHKSGASITFLNLKIHDWGQIHFIASIVFLVLLLIHIMFHVNWIASVYKTIIKNKPAAFIIALIFITIIIIFLTFPFIIKPVIKEKSPHSKHNAGVSYEKSCVIKAW